MIKDVYFSQKAFNLNTWFDGFYNEALIDGEWKKYTEIISVEKKPLSLHEDLTYLGVGTDFKHVRINKLK